MTATLHRLFGPPAAGADELLALRARAWRQQGVAVLWVDRISDPGLRGAVEQLAVRLYGARDDTGGTP